MILICSVLHKPHHHQTASVPGSNTFAISNSTFTWLVSSIRHLAPSKFYSRKYSPNKYKLSLLFYISKKFVNCWTRNAISSYLWASFKKRSPWLSVNSWCHSFIDYCRACLSVTHQWLLQLVEVILLQFKANPLDPVSAIWIVAFNNDGVGDLFNSTRIIKFN